MGFITRWLKRRRELAQLAPRMRELEAELSRALGPPVSLKPAATKGGYDEIFYVMQATARIAVLRVNSPFKENHDPVGPRDPGVPLGDKERLDREWTAYQRLAPSGLSPKPLWRGDGAIACSWLPWDRVSNLLKSPRDSFWPLMQRIIPAIAKMHELGVTHLDLNAGNILSEPGGIGIAFIDFEFGPQPWVTLAQQQAFDYLRLIDNCTKRRRGGAQMMSDLDCLLRLLETSVSTQAREADIAFSLEKLQLLAAQPLLCQRLRAIFPKL